MPSAISVVLSPSAQPGGLLDVANPLPNGWERGVIVSFGSNASPERVGPCDVPSGDTAEPTPPAEFSAVLLRLAVLCSTLGRPKTAEWAADNLRVTADWALSQELLDGVGTGNPNLSTAVSAGTATTIEEAIRLLEQAAYDALKGRQAVLHIPPGLLPVDYAAFDRDGKGRLVSPAGSLIAVHGSGDKMYATGEIWAEYASVDSREYINHATNKSEGTADGIGIVVFDPSFMVFVQVTP